MTAVFTIMALLEVAAELLQQFMVSVSLFHKHRYCGKVKLYKIYLYVICDMNQLIQFMVSGGLFHTHRYHGRVTLYTIYSYVICVEVGHVPSNSLM